MLMLRTRAFDLLLALEAALLGPAIPVLMVLRRPGWNRAAIRLWVGGMFGLSRLLLSQRLREEGCENKHLHAPCLYVCNHQSAWETLAFNRLVPDVSIVAKQELGRIPVFGWYLRHAPMILIDRSAGARALNAMVTQARAAVAQGRSILIFPEGTRVGIGAHRAFQPGLAMLYRKLGLPVVPVAHDAGACWTGRIKRGGTITVSWMPPIPPGLPPAEFMTRVETLVNDRKDQLPAAVRAG